MAYTSTATIEARTRRGGRGLVLTEQPVLSVPGAVVADHDAASHLLAKVDASRGVLDHFSPSAKERPGVPLKGMEVVNFGSSGPMQRQSRRTHGRALACAGRVGTGALRNERRSAPRPPLQSSGVWVTLYLWQPQDFNLCEQRNTLVFWNAEFCLQGQDEKERCPR